MSDTRLKIAVNLILSYVPACDVGYMDNAEQGELYMTMVEDGFTIDPQLFGNAIVEIAYDYADWVEAQDFMAMSCPD